MRFLTKLSKKEKLGIFAAVIIISAAFLDRLIVAPINEKIQQINHEIRVKEKQIGWDLRNLRQKDSIAKEYDKYAQYIKKVGSDEEEIAKILGELEELARKSSVRLVNLKPRPPTTPDDYCKEYLVEIEAEGGMESLVEFLYQLSQSSQLLHAQRIQLSSKEKDSPEIRMNIIVTKALIL